MFGGEEDFFDDDDFLQDVLQIETDADSISTKKINSLFVPQDLQTPSLQDRKDDEVSDRKILNKRFVPENTAGTSKYVTNDSFDFSDDFPLDLDDEGVVSGQQLQGDDTPPDSAFTIPRPLLSSEQQIEGYNSPSTNGGKVDFRSKILKTLNETKKLSELSQDGMGTTVLQESMTNNSMSVLRPEKRKAPLDTSVNDKSSSPLGKRPHFRENAERTSIPQSLLTNQSSQMTRSIKSHTVGNGLNSICTVVNNNNQQDKGISFVVSSTPVKRMQTSIRTTRSPGGPLIQRRKFPGPAGILPDLGSSASESSILKLQEKATPVPAPQEVVCSQNSASDFTCGPWQQMLNDLELDKTNPKCPLEVFNIRWVLRRASLRGQAAVRKVPFLAVMLRNLDMTHVDAQALLKDKTGEMNATIASTVMEEYGSALQTGSVLLLRGVTVLSPVGVRNTAREHSRKHYLNITLNTILTIYTPDDSGNVVRTLISEVDKNELYKEAAAPKAAACSRAIVEEEEDEIVEVPLSHNQSLFSMNDSMARNSPYPNQVAFNQQQLPNYKSPRVAGNNPAQSLSPRVQTKNNSSHPGIANPPQSRGFQTSRPSILTPLVNRNLTARPQRPQLTTQQPWSQNSHVVQSKPNFSFRPSGQQAVISAPGKIGNGSHGSFPNNNSHLKETDEKEINDLLNDVDAESLFGDF